MWSLGISRPEIYKWCQCGSHPRMQGRNNADRWTQAKLWKTYSDTVSISKLNRASQSATWHLMSMPLTSQRLFMPDCACMQNTLSVLIGELGASSWTSSHPGDKMKLRSDNRLKLQLDWCCRLVLPSRQLDISYREQICLSYPMRLPM